MLEAEDDDNFDEFSEAISKRDRLWKVENGIVAIPYTLSRLLMNDEKIKIKQAIEEYHTKTCIRYVNITCNLKFIQKRKTDY